MLDHGSADIDYVDGWLKYQQLAAVRLPYIA